MRRMTDTSASATARHCIGTDNRYAENRHIRRQSPYIRHHPPPLSWNEGAAKQSIIEFVKSTTTEGSRYIRPHSGANRHIR